MCFAMTIASLSRCAEINDQEEILIGSFQPTRERDPKAWLGLRLRQDDVRRAQPPPARRRAWFHKFHFYLAHSLAWCLWSQMHFLLCKSLARSLCRVMQSRRVLCPTSRQWNSILSLFGLLEVRQADTFNDTSFTMKQQQMLQMLIVQLPK